jgi:5'-3' exoribonuclease 1
LIKSKLKENFSLLKMGIPFYFYRICQKYKILRNSPEISKCDNLYFDYNSLIHPCVREIGLDKDQDTLIDGVLEYTTAIIDFINPKKVYIAIDGVAPRAKMNQQRERRYKKVFLEENSDGLFDTNMITPGTQFMKLLSERLTCYFKNFRIDVVISDASERGEGEHKIMRIINDTPEDRADTVHCIYGMDGDLIMLSLMSDKKIVLFRDDKSKNGSTGEGTFLEIKTLKRCICLHLNRHDRGDSDCHDRGDNDRDKHDRGDRRTVIEYILICFLLGNDFLPNFENLSLLRDGIEILEKSYIITKNRGVSLVDIQNGIYHVNWRGFSHFIDQLEICLSKRQGIDHMCRFKDTVPDNPRILLNLIDMGWVANDTRETRETRETRDMYNLYYSLDSFTPKNWLTGLEWVLGYYQTHHHNNWTWYYEYENAPSIKDVKQTLKDCFVTRVTPSKPFTESQQLFMVLPKESIKRIGDSKMCKLSESDEFKLYFPEKLLLDGVNKTFIWQCTPLGLHQFDELLVRNLVP